MSWVVLKGMARGTRRKLHFSKLYSFVCGRSKFEVDHSQIGGPGFSRVAYANAPDCSEAGNLNYGSNYVSTTKYTLATFFPKSLFEQFRRVANLYFLFTAFLSFTSLAPYSAVSIIIPLIVVIGATMLKEAIEDWRRYRQDIKVNNRKVELYHRSSTFGFTEWKNLRVGDIVKVEKDNFFPVDLVMLSSSYEDGICYVETMNLDGETNLKLKQSLEVTSGLQADSSFQNFKMIIKCEDPNASLYTFVGTMEYEDQEYPLSPQQLLLRDSKLRNTDYIYGVVVFTGHDTKVMQNAMNPPSKRSKIEMKMDKLIYLLLFSLVVFSSVGSVVFGIISSDDLQDGKVKRWYFRPDDSSIYYDPKRAAVAAILHFLTAIMLYSYFIPISLYVSIEIVKVLQSIFINQDIQMYHEESNKPARARTSNLNEELGQVATILSDKTGTLTCNSMEFIKCSIAGIAYGHGFTEVERAIARRKGSLSIENEQSKENHEQAKPAIKGYNFDDARIVNGNWVYEPHSDIIRMFFRLLAICHTAIPEVDEETGKISYEAESPDEAAFVIAARELGFEFYQRTQTRISIHELDPVSCKHVEKSYKLLNVLEFNSSRKRMSVVVQDDEGKLLLLSKGADSVMFEKLGKGGRGFENKTKEHMHEYADAGLRTLVLAYRRLDEEEYKSFNKRFMAAKNSVTTDRDEKIEEVADSIERNLILLGATAVEDKLQNGVPECIDKLAQAGIKIWVLTGDKMETAINIGFACSLLRQGMKQIIITLDGPEIIHLEKDGNKEAIAKVSRDSVLYQINEGTKLLSSSNTESFALVIDGRSLAYALEDDAKNLFLQLAVGCASVICCRSSPKQKALVTRLVKAGSGKVTLAIGDGANDVGMLQEADIGVGISGAEGMQAVMASDIAISQFRFLERLLLVHGHWCYRRISLMICYFFYKNLTFGLTLFLYEAYSSFSGQPAYDDWYMSLYNVAFTSLPAIALGVFDQDVSARFCLKFPMLYQEGVQNLLFNWLQILSWMFSGVCNGIMIFFFCTTALEHQAFRKGGEVIDLEVLGATMYTCVVWVVNCQMALSISYFTLIQHMFIWGGIALWYLFLLAYGAVTPTLSTSAFMVFVEGLAPAPAYWIITLFIVIATLLPCFIYLAIQMRFFPMHHNMIQWMRFDGHADDPEYCQVVRQRSVRPTTVGVSARVDATVSQLARKVHDVVHLSP
ncbi:unnamed protein product [Musa acuminata var. zebrina]